ncbi:MAG: L-threonylcarbamoyladenylate synthase [Candidatus Paceibacterota bacterium]
MKKEEIIKIFKNGGVGVIPTDTIYGLVGDALSKKAVERIYEIKGRDKKKPFIVLISSIKDLKKFGINIQSQNLNILNKFWPGNVSIVLPCNNKKFEYLHRGIKAVAFRLPSKKFLLEILKKTGPLVSTSANLSYLKSAENITEAKKYFKNNVDFYLSGGTLRGKPSMLIKLNKNEEIDVLRGKL